MLNTIVSVQSEWSRALWETYYALIRSLTAPAGALTQPAQFEAIRVGDCHVLSRRVSEQDVFVFAAISGDMNPVHLNQGFARRTRFKRPIVHGALTASYISAAISDRYVGAIYVRQSVTFRAPVYAGATVVTTLDVRELETERKRFTLGCACSVEGSVVLDGEAVLWLPKME